MTESNKSRSIAMPSNSASARFAFTQIYDTLSPEAQQALVKDKLVALLDLVPKDQARKVIAAATYIKKRSAGMPILDLKAKEKEMGIVLGELRRDIKHAIFKGFSHREELIAEAVQSVFLWLNDIWSVVYEYSVNFTLAHTCLLFTNEVLLDIGGCQGDGCNCEFKNMFVSFKLKKESGEIVKSFSFRGAQKIQQILLWIWRDLFLSLLASSPQPDDKQIFGMFSDIENSMGWQYLYRLLYGGRLSPCCDAFDVDDTNEDFCCDDEEYDDQCSYCEYSGDETDSSFDSADNDLCGLRSRHWSSKIKKQRSRLRQYVFDHLESIFKITPSLALFDSIIAIRPNSPGIANHLSGLLLSSATSSSETFAAALDIFRSEGKAKAISSLLNSHFHMLRPRDAPSLQGALILLSFRPSFQLRSLQILEREFISTARSIAVAVSACFSSIDKQSSKAELSRIAQLRNGSTMRQDRVRQWVDSVITPTTNSANPMAFAAMMMGLPFVPDETDGPDPYGLLDVEQNDKDLDSLRDELRPKFKDRFDGWNETAQSMKGGAGLLLRIYSKTVELMPYIQAPDVVEEMISRLGDKPSKHHICDALNSLSSFSKLHRRKLRKPSNNQTPTTQGSAKGVSQTQTASSNVSSTGTRTSLHSTKANIMSSSSVASPPEVGGMNDVD